MRVIVEDEVSYVEMLEPSGTRIFTSIDFIFCSSDRSSSRWLKYYKVVAILKLI